MKEVIDSFNPTDAASIAIWQELLDTENTNIESQLAYISSNFLQLKDAIIALEKVGLPLSEALAVLMNVTENIPLGPVGITI